ncbi:hypothetical protein [Sulfitobacter phage EE36phi1]|uniref:Uncharacterized protein n=1 Tax=Sulfitobacter phage EE36phi1 TaxID=490913 RepID=C4NTC9_9CAUD|nr:hypothetical protein EE36P1_gp46 [Sulfitobacter phage EE36phi1]ACL81395.1 hypothetical protein [Sulfitobacter phage EE36phi1]
MIEISYENVKNGLEKQISMTCLCTTQQETDRVFRNALVLWGDLPTTRPHLNERLIDFVDESGKMFCLIFKDLKPMLQVIGKDSEAFLCFILPSTHKKYCHECTSTTKRW